jgi:hypothetical protein
MSLYALGPEKLTGRDRELGFMREFFQRAVVSGGALHLSGDTGAGKTRCSMPLVDAAAESVTLVVRAAGAELEAEISCSDSTRRCC